MATRKPQDKTNTEWFDALHAPVQEDKVLQREGWRDRNGRVHMVDYVEWHTVADILDNVCGNHWDWRIQKIDVTEQVVVVHGSLTIRSESPDGSIELTTRDGIGMGIVGNQKNAEEVAIKGAASDALKRAAVLFGIARELYSGEVIPTQVDEDQEEDYDRQIDEDPKPRRHTRQREKEEEVDERPTRSPRRSDSNQARSSNDMISAKQLGLIKGLADDNDFDADEECDRLMGCAVQDLSKKTASEFIDALLKEYSSKRRSSSATSNRSGGRRSQPSGRSGGQRRQSNEPMSEKQEGMIFAVCKKLGLDANEECTDTLGCELDELTKSQASEFIEHLQDIEEKQR